MHESILQSGRDGLLVGIPLVALLLIGCFRADELIFRSNQPKKRKPPPASGVDEHGHDIFCDPDGRLGPLQVSNQVPVGAGEKGPAESDRQIRMPTSSLG